MVVQSLGQPLRGPSSSQGPWLTGIVGLFYVPWPSYSYLVSRVSVVGLDLLSTYRLLMTTLWMSILVLFLKQYIYGKFYAPSVTNMSYFSLVLVKA